MIRRDYILRMIDEMVKLIAALLGLLKKGEIEQAQKIYNEGILRALDMDEDTLLQIDLDKLVTIFEVKYGESYEGLETIATLLSRGGDIHLKSGDELRSKQCYFKSLEILNLVELKSDSFSLNRQAEMNKLNQLLHQL